MECASSERRILMNVGTECGCGESCADAHDGSFVAGFVLGVLVGGYVTCAAMGMLWWALH